MRSIKFRGKTKGTEKCVDGLWVYGYLFKDVDDKSFILYDFPGSFGNKRLQKIEVIPETVGQFTGRKDVDGVEIYRGDIILVPYNRIGQVEVKYIPHECRYNINSYNLDRVSVVGNIHETEVSNG